MYAGHNPHRVLVTISHARRAWTERSGQQKILIWLLVELCNICKNIIVDKSATVVYAKRTTLRHIVNTITTAAP